MKTREEIATAILEECPDEGRADHERMAQWIREGEPVERIIHSPEAERWPLTQLWLRGAMREYWTEK